MKSWVQTPNLEKHNTLWWTNKKLWKMAIEIVGFPIKNGASFHGKMLVHQRVMILYFLLTYFPCQLALLCQWLSSPVIPPTPTHISNQRPPSRRWPHWPSTAPPSTAPGPSLLPSRIAAGKLWLPAEIPLEKRQPWPWEGVSCGQQWYKRKQIT